MFDGYLFLRCYVKNIIIMEKKIASFKEYEIFLADKSCLGEIANFVVWENYAHHLSSFNEAEFIADVAVIFEEECYLYDENSYIYIARTYNGRMIGCIRTFHWDKFKTLPMEKIFGINPLKTIHDENKYNYWHIGRFAVAKRSGISTFTLFKRLMAFAVKPVIEDKYSYLIAEIDSRLLHVMKVLGFVTRQVGQPIEYLASETVPICVSKRGINGFYVKYGCLNKAI